MLNFGRTTFGEIRLVPISPTNVRIVLRNKLTLSEHQHKKNRLSEKGKGSLELKAQTNSYGSRIYPNALQP